MLIKSIEIVIIILIIFFIFFYFFEFSYFVYKYYKENYLFLEKFLEGRLIIKYITENNNFSDGICKLKNEFLYSIKENLSDILNSLGINRSIKLKLIDLINEKTIYENDFSVTNVILFSRVCYYNGSPILIKIYI